MFASVLEFLGYNLTRLEEYGRRLVVPLYAFTLMRALAKKIDTSPWAKQLPLHLAEQTLIHVTNSFLEAPLYNRFQAFLPLNDHRRTLGHCRD
jgi:hypothetical protein